MLIQLQYIALAVAAGAVVGITHYYIEELGYQLCLSMARHGHMRRLAPGTKRLYQVRLPSISDSLLPPYKLSSACHSRVILAELLSSSVSHPQTQTDLQSDRPWATPMTADATALSHATTLHGSCTVDVVTS